MKIYDFDSFLMLMNLKGYKLADILNFRDHYQNLLNNEENENELIKYIKEIK